MLKTVEDISTTKKRLVIEIPADVLEQEIKDGLEKLKRTVKLPGYRKGKVPISLIIKRFGKDVEGEALEKVVPRFYAEAVKEADLRPVGHPQMESGLHFEREKPLEMTLTLEVRPPIEGLNYEGVKLREVPVEVKDEEVEEAINNLREKKSVFEPVEEPVEDGYMAVLDYSTDEDGQSYTDQDYRVGQGIMPEAFASQVKGMKKGEEKEFSVPFPEDFPSQDLAGKDVHFTVKVKDVKKPRMPELDDELAKDVGFDTLDALRQHARNQILASKENTVRKMHRAGAVQSLLDANEFEAPMSLVEMEITGMVEEAKQGGRTESVEELRQELKETAVKRVRASILVDTIADREGIEAGEEEVKNKLAEMAGHIGMTPENIMKYYISRDGSMDGLRHEVIEEKVLDLLLEKAEFEKGQGEEK